MRQPTVVVLCVVALAGCATTPSLILPAHESAQGSTLTTLLKQYPLGEGQNIRAVALGQTNALSYHMVQIRDREQPHVHATHDLSVTLLRGAGRLYIRGTPHDMRPGDVALVPHGTPHQFVNTESTPAVAFVTFAPPYDGKDQVPEP
jgi:quercetin dioxygenase-like cupin family protein